MIDSLVAKLAVFGGIGLTSVATFGHSLFSWGGQSNQGGTTNTLESTTNTEGTSGTNSQISNTSQVQESVKNLKELKNCFSALSFNSKDHLLACIDKASNSNLVFYYYNSTKDPTLTEKIVSLKGKREWNTKSTITLKRSNNQEITLKDISVDHSSIWFWSSWLNRELKLESICQNTSVPLEHNSGKRPLTCQWTLKEHGGQSRSGREVWQPFNFVASNVAK